MVHYETVATILSMAFPFQQGSSTFPKQATDDDAINASIIQILSTRRGERINRPTFGCNLHDYVFENNSAATQDGLSREVRTAISTWEPRVTVKSVTVDAPNAVEPGEILVTISYSINTSGLTGVVSVGV